ncbi:MAG: hypothetical protein Q9220_006117 [cf. Caloplaca sp. 1 TL-2023]
MPASSPRERGPDSQYNRFNTISSLEEAQKYDPHGLGYRPNNIQVAGNGGRKPTPSPLQTSESFSMTPNGKGQNDVKQATSSIFQYPASSSHSSPHSPRSPRLAERSQPTSPQDRLDQVAAQEGSTGARTVTSPSSAPTKADSYHSLRNISAPVPLSKPLGSSPPTSPVRTASTPFISSAVRPDLRSMPRTSSIESAISTLSSTTSHSHKSSQDSNASTTTEIAHLIVSAGSAEAVIQHLLRERQNLAVQNGQLWKLVDKQRTLVLGLNQDLERALRDKERYRKKLKENLSQVPPIPHTALHDRVDSRAGSQSPATESCDGTPIQRNRDRDTVILDPRLASKSINEASAGVLTSSRDVKGSSEMPIPGMTTGSTKTPTDATSLTSTTAFQEPLDLGRPGKNVAPIQTSNLNIDRSNRVDMPRYSESISQSIDAVVSPNSFTRKRSLPFAQKTVPNPSLQLTESTPPSSAGEKVQLPLRKLPPAPLDLRPTHREARYGPDDHSGSEYEDNVEVDELPALERGRKKTREDDDRDREAALLREEANRSRSSKSKGSKPPSDASLSTITQPSMPPAIKSLHPEQSSTAGTSGFLAAPSSLASVLSPPTAQSSMTKSRTLSALPISPGLPVSPRPIDRPLKSPTPRMHRDAPGSYGTSPPVSPRSGFVGLPLSPRAPRQPIPMPPHTPMSLVSPIASSLDSQKEPITESQRLDSPRGSQSERSIVSPDAREPSLVETAIPQSRGIYRGFVSEAYPDLLIPPNALPSIIIKVNSSRLKPSRLSYLGHKGSEEDSVFTLGISARSDMQELWQVEKPLLSLPHLDHQLKKTSAFDAKLPDRSLFGGHAPAKIDARRAALERYFETVLDTPMDEKAAIALCRYLSTQATEPLSDESVSNNISTSPASPVKKGSGGRLIKEGYLTKRGKNFGGWKARFFVLDEPLLRYYESPGGTLLGTIKLQNAQIGKQSTQQSSSSPTRSTEGSESQYRHAFLILEPKRRDSNSYVRHVLCAESDAERDIWVDALLYYVENQARDESTRPQLSSMDSSSSKVLKKQMAKKDGATTESPESAIFEGLQALSYESTRPAPPPVISVVPQRADADTPSPPIVDGSSGSKTSQASKPISGPSNGVRIEDAGAWGNKAPHAKDIKEPKKRGIWGFRDRNPDPSSQVEESRMSFIEPPTVEINPNARPTFGVPLAEAVEFCSPKNVDVCLPAVVYRCLEYLGAQDAASEEGIFRLSGSSVVIKALKDRFNNQGDFDFLADGQYYDVHAVASLLKLYLRELPSTVLTRELHLDFLAVLELDSKPRKIAAYNMLVHRLPKANWTLIRSLSAFLIGIVNNSDVNKMSVRNVGIVFSPTLNIPAPVFSMFLTDFDAVFGEEPRLAPAAPMEVSINEPLTPEDIRSPRRQMFSDIPTPSYNQTQFPQRPSYEHLPAPSQRSNDVGFVPMQPSYEAQVVPGPEPRTTTRSLAPESAVKARRRESSMLLMSGDQRKSSLPLLRGDAEALREEQAYS